MSIYRKKPVDVVAYQITDNKNEFMNIIQWMGSDNVDGWDVLPSILYIKTLEGIMKAKTGDYVVQGVRGEFWAVRQDIFEETYEKVMEVGGDGSCA